MPRDANGNTSPLPGTIVSLGQTLLPSQHNPMVEDLYSMMTDSLSRSGQGAMLAALDAGGFQVRNMAAATLPNDAIRKTEFDAQTTAIAGKVDRVGGTMSADPTVALGVATKQYVDGKTSGRNRIINGDMRVAQFGTSFSSPTNLTHTLDGWGVRWSGAAPATIAQITGPTGFRNALRVTGAASNTRTEIVQAIESFNTADLVGFPVSIQVVALASSAQTGLWELHYANATDNCSTTTLISSGTWSITTSAQRFTATSGTLPANAANGLMLKILPNNGGAFTSGTFDITGAQLEVGTGATPFEFIDFSEQLSKCQRRGEKSYNYGVSVGSATTSGVVRFGQGASSTLVYANAEFKSEKRAIPTVRTWDEAGNLTRMSFYSAAAGAVTNNLNALSSNWQGTTNWGFSANTATAGAAGTYTIHWEARADILI